MADPVGEIRARVDIWADTWQDRRRRTSVRNAALRREFLRPRLVAFGMFFVIAAVAALILGRSLGHDGTARPASFGVPQVDGGRLALAGWSGWLPTEMPSVLGGEIVVNASAAKPLLMDGVTVVVGDVRDGEVPRILSLLRPSDATDRELGAGDLRVRAYTGRLVGRAPLTATVLLVPTADGVSAAVCVGDPRASATAASDCRSLLPTTTALRRSAPIPASPDAAAAGAVSNALARLDRVRRRGVAVLATTPTSGRQALAATRLSAAYTRAARSVGRVSFTTLAAASGTALADGLAAGARGYRALAAAARAHSLTAFGRARTRVATADASLARSLAELSALGYGNRK